MASLWLRDTATTIGMDLDPNSADSVRAVLQELDRRLSAVELGDLPTRVDMRMELTRVYEHVDVEPPSVDAVIHRAWTQLAQELREEAVELAGCDSVDECSAKAIFLRALADEMDRG